MAGRLAPLTLLVALALMGAAVSAAPARGNIVKRLDYETGGLGQWNYVQALPGRVAVVSRPKRQGHYAARFTVKPGDRPVGGSGERAELTSLTGEHAGMTSWWRWSTFFPRHFNPVRGTWNVFTQWHQTQDACSPPLQFTVDASGHPARMYLRVKGGRLNTRTCSASYSRSFRMGTLHLRHWYRFVLQVKWSPYKSRGFLRLWVNGRRRVKSHAATLYKGQGVYAKQGFYRGPSSKTSIIFHDGMQRFRP